MAPRPAKELDALQDHYALRNKGQYWLPFCASPPLAEKLTLDAKAGRWQ